MSSNKETKNQKKLQPDYNKTSNMFRNISGNETLRETVPHWTERYKNQEKEELDRLNLEIDSKTTTAKRLVEAEKAGVLTKQQIEDYKRKVGLTDPQPTSNNGNNLTETERANLFALINNPD